MSDAKPVEIGRLKLRVQGTHWVAHFEVKPGSEMYLGQIAMSLITDGRNGQQRKQEFLKLMADCVNDVIETVLGQRSTMGKPERAPESERSGNA